MRVLCPVANHPINIPDDFGGTQIVCPQCNCVIVLDPKERSSAIQANAPPNLSATPVDSREPKNLHEQIYDGLPPLAVMMALKRREGPAYDADDDKLKMSEDDWKALAAFESL